MELIRKNEPVIRFLTTLSLSLAFGLGCAGPAWELYLRLKSLGSGQLLSRGVFTARYMIFGTAGALAVLVVMQALCWLWGKRRAEVTRPCSDLELWLVGTYAIWGQYYAGMYGSGLESARRAPFYIGAVPRTRETVEEMKETLRDSWRIKSWEDLLSTVEYMSAGPGFESCLSRADLAWELCRSMQLLGCAYLVRWCSREEMVWRSCEVGKRIQENFYSWDDLCQSFLEGFNDWKTSGAVCDEDRRSVHRRIEVYLLIKGRKDSPYRLPWRMELAPGKK